MRNALIVAALLLLPAAALADGPPAAKPADVPLPWDPLAEAIPGDWARYRVLDPEATTATAGPDAYEICVVRTITASAVIIMDEAGKAHRYLRDEAGKSALAFLRGFFGEGAAAELDGLEKLAVTPDSVEMAGRREEGVRIDATIATKLPEAASTLRAELRIWLARGVRAGGVARATIDVTYGERRHSGSLELDGQGDASQSSKVKERTGAGPAAPTGTAEAPR